MKTTAAFPFLQGLLISLFALFAAGCHGSASMRIDVEVYNGPLAKTEVAQKAELESSLEHAKRVLVVVTDDLEISECRLGCRGERNYECQKGDRSLWFEDDEDGNGSEDTADSRNQQAGSFSTSSSSDPGIRNAIQTDKQDELIQVCPMIVDLREDAESLGEEATTCKVREGLQLLKCASKLGHRLRSSAEFWATKHIGIISDSIRARIGLVELTTVAAELGNEISARADALLKQDAIARAQLPTSTYLQDSGATDYLNLVDWFNAAVEREGSRKVDRVRMIERLITDTHWSKINTVFAAGQGEVRMVFVKDDIGNWNLKSFSNDPTELLNAYKNIGFAALSTVDGLARGGGSIGELQGFMQFANDVALGSGGGPDELLSIDSLHARTASRIRDLPARQEQRRARLEVRIEELGGEVEQLKQGHEEKEAAIRELVIKRNDLERERKGKKSARSTLLVEIGGLQEQQRPRDTGEPPTDNQDTIAQQVAAKQAEAEQLESDIEEFRKSVAAKDAEIMEAEEELRHSSQALVEKQNKLAASRAEQERLGADTRGEVRAILEGHEEILDLLQGSVVKSPTDKSSIAADATPATVQN